MTQQQKDAIREEYFIKIINILSYQQSITNQGINYTGEKDWALNKILGLIEEAYQQGVESRQDEIDSLREEAYGDLKDNT